MGSTISPTVLSNDATHPRIRPIKLNAHWPTSKKPYDWTTGEFLKWSNKLEIFLQQCGLDRYVFAPESRPDRLITEPDKATEPMAHDNWLGNNDLIIGVIHATILDAEQEDLHTDGMAKECYDALCARAQREGPIKQVALIHEALTTYVPVSEPLKVTARKICELINHAFAVGTIDKDLLKCIALLNSINNKSFKSLQTQVSRGLADSTTSNPYRSINIRKLFQTIDSLSTLSKPPSSDLALSTRDSNGHIPGHNHGPGQMCCEVCRSIGSPCQGHTKQYCVRPGGGMAGKMIEESIAAQKATRGGGKSKTGGGGNTGTPKNGIAVKGLDSQAYIVDMSHLQKIQLDTALTPKPNEFAGMASSDPNSTDFFEYQGFMAMDVEPTTSIDWNINTAPGYKSILATTTIAPPNQNEHTTLVSLTEKPFYLDSGATVHISPCISDFVTLQAIPP